MYPNPFHDAWLFVSGQTNDYNNLGTWKYLLVILFLLLVVASTAIAIRNWRIDPTQRTGAATATWLMRVLIGAMWFEGMLWKLPLFSRGNGLYYWMEQMGQRAAFAWHRELVANVYLPFFEPFNLMILLAELTFAVCLILGFGVRFVGMLAVLFALHLWLGIYRAGDPAEWAWSYIFLAVVHALFAIHAAGRCLGLDALLRRSLGADSKSGLVRLYRAAS